MIICNKEDCCGCFACANACPQSCIEMKEDEWGYKYPIIDKDKCINCGICKNKCPIINETSKNAPIKCYAGIYDNLDETKNSTSGGIAYIISKEILSNDGVVYGAAIVDGLKTNHIRIEDEKDLNRIQGSKYLMSDLNNTFNDIRKRLENNQLVLFTGTPCQVAGLNSFLGKEYENLTCIDIICHGVPSYKFLMDYIQENGFKGNRYSFRKGVDYYYQMFDDSTLLSEVYYRESEYIMGFLNNLTQRENCFDCRYASVERCSDITLGDYWGIEGNVLRELNAETGISLILINTKKGEEIFNMIVNHIKFKERTVEDAISKSTPLREAPKKHKKRDRFKRLYLSKGFSKSIRKILYKEFFKYKVKTILKKD